MSAAQTHPLNIHHLLILLALIRNPGGLSCGELAKRIKVSKASITGLRDRLVKDGWVTTLMPPHDRRTIILHPTPRTLQFGDAIKARFWAEPHEAFEKMLRKFAGHEPRSQP